MRAPVFDERTNRSVFSPDKKDFSDLPDQIEVRRLGTEYEVRAGRPLAYLDEHRLTVSHILHSPRHGLMDGWVVLGKSGHASDAATCFLRQPAMQG